jgi:S-DNA-T family DNA segregation ATPase FtsK/SpoIIIE
MAANGKRRRKRGWLSEVWGLALWVAATLLVMSLWSYHPRDLSWFGGNEDLDRAQNLAGIFGATLSELLYQIVGVGSWLLPPLLFGLGWSRIRPVREEEARPSWLVGGASVLLGVCTLSSLLQTSVWIEGEALRSGGWIGEACGRLLERHLNRPGAIVVALTLILVSSTLMLQMSVARVGGSARRLGTALGSRLLVVWSRWRETRRKRRLREEVLRKQAARRPIEVPRAAAPDGDDDAESAAEPAEPRVSAADAAPGRGAGASLRPAPRVKRSAEAPPAAAGGAVTLPPLTLLDPPAAESPVDEKELIAKARMLTEKFQEFDVQGSVVQIHPGPVVTTFEFKPEAGIKFSKMTGLVDDLALALKAESVRIDRISGHSTVGVEVPNRQRETIRLREILASEACASSTSKLTLGIGKRIDGEVYVADLARMPHLLIAGATGTGKSVSLNSIITSILFRATPDEVKFVMIDTKRLELGMYEDIPHLLTPVVVEPKHAANALRWTVQEMERRYRTLAEVGVRNIDQYNGLLRGSGRRLRHAAEGRGADGRAGSDASPAGAGRHAAGAGSSAGATAGSAGAGDEARPLPYLVVVIDELADLMLASAREVEESITRLAQMARAVGIHLILSTQRPSVDIITGVIKANFPSRIAFRVSSKVDSRTIIDTNGAEKLLGNGDMLFIPPGTSRLLRLHGALITEAESHRVVDYLKRQARPVYDPNVIRGDEEEEGRAAGGRLAERDSLYEEAVRLVVGAGQASVSHLQRRLRLGYARAARLMDQLEADGIVGPPDGSKMRQVLVDHDFLDNLAQREENI